MTNEIYLYHITDLDNLKQIIKHDALIAKNSLANLKISPIDIAEQSVQKKRFLKPVPLPPYGTLHDYVPFYFCVKSPMLYSIHKGNVQSYNKGQVEIIYLVIKLSQLISLNQKCIYTDGHGIMEVTEFYDDASSLSKLDWDAIRSDKWGYPYFTEDQDMKRRKQSEFLVYQKVPWQLVFGIGVHNAVIEEQVSAIINYSGHKPQIKIKESYYFDPSYENAE